MKALCFRAAVTAQALLRNWREESGQDLIEYALVCALVAFGAIAGMQTLANGINTAFGNVSTTLTSNA